MLIFFFKKNTHQLATPVLQTSVTWSNRNPHAELSHAGLQAPASQPANWTDPAPGLLGPCLSSTFTKPSRKEKPAAEGVERGLSQPWWSRRGVREDTHPPPTELVHKHTQAELLGSHPAGG
uniref:Uncharacterized protein n=1 Tax=Sphaerodactylus townsendi TaxID=933632 RepID=A0ACB8E5A8_9SAUR